MDLGVASLFITVITMKFSQNPFNSKFTISLLFFLDINECLSSPCQNNGTCQNRKNQYRCVCKPGFKGRNCQKSRLLL